MKNIRLIVCDIDNTLVVKHKNISPFTKKVIHELKNKNIMFALASGRGISSLKTLEKQWGIECDLLIGLNGSEMYDGINDITETFYEMKAEWIKQCIEIMKPFNCNPSIRRNDVSYVVEIDERTRSSQAYLKNQQPPHIVKDISEFWESSAPKVGFRIYTDDINEIERYVANSLPKNSEFIGFKTENTMFEFTHAKANKGALLKVFCERNNINLKNVCSFGDMTNDISLLEVSGIGVCMLNGSDDTKAVADYITEKNVEDDGWPYFVKKHILDNLN